MADPSLAAWLAALQEASFARAGRPIRESFPPQRRMTGPQLAGYLERRRYALVSSARPDGRAHAAPTLFVVYAEAFWLPTVGGAARLRHVAANPWLALSVVEGEGDAHAAVLIEGPAQAPGTAPDYVRDTAELRTTGDSIDWVGAWLRVTPQRLFSYAGLTWQRAATAYDEPWHHRWD